MLAGRGGSLIAVVATFAASVIAAGAPAAVPERATVAEGAGAVPQAALIAPPLPEPLLFKLGAGRSRPTLGSSSARSRARARGAPTLPTPSSGPTTATAACTPASLVERASRVLLVGLPNVTAADDPLVAELLDVGVGGVLLTHANVISRDQVTALVSALRAGSKGPLLVSADEEPGRVRTFESVLGFVPSARRLATEETATEVQDLARTSGRDLASIGVNVALAPVADLDAGPWDGTIGDRSFSADPILSSTYALAYARGLQESGVIPVVKHFPGQGRASDDVHIEFAEVGATLGDLMGTDLRPFTEAIEAGAPVVMMGHVAYDALEPGVPASMSAAAYRLLRQLGFSGAAITDSIGMGAVNLRWDFDEAAVRAVAAGADGVLATDGWQARRMRDALVAAVQSGNLDEARLDEAAGRMMALAGGDPGPLSCRSPGMPTLR